MIRIYLIILVCALFVGAYFYGENRGASKCQIKNLESQIEKTEQIQQNKRNLDDKVYKTGVRDIRDILRAKYTIAQ